MLQTRKAGEIDTQALELDLRARIRGEVRFDDGARGLYATDASNYRQPPIGVVIPRSIEDVVQAVAAARRHNAPVLPRGGGTSLAGQCCNTAVVIDMSKYLDRILDIDPARKTARVQPGVIPDRLNEQANRHKLAFAPVPATRGWCTIGGNIGNNSCGIHSVMGGRTADNVEELEVLTYDGVRLRVGRTSPEELERLIAEGGRVGEIYGKLRDLRDRYADLVRARYPKIPRLVSGFSLDQLLPENGFHVARALVGSEGTCVTVLEATVNLVHSPPSRALLVLGYPDVFAAGDHVPNVMAHKPTALEGLDHRLVQYNQKKRMNEDGVALLTEGQGWLLAEFGGETDQEAEERARAVMHELGGTGAPAMRLLTSRREQELIWQTRESGLGATARVPGEGDTWPGWEDSAVPPEKVGDYLRDLRKLFDNYGYNPALYGHFGQGCIHTRINFDLVTAEGIRSFRSFMEEAADLVVRYGGSLSGEHGDGQARAELLEKQFGRELVQAFRGFKAIWDPDGQMNPGKVVDPYGLDENLRLGPEYRPWHPTTYFSLPEDDGSLARAATRCVGVGKCRRETAGTMCPSYMVTKEEQHTTRGRARLLFEMLVGNPVGDGWRSEAVKESLDLCLACKGCKGECPVNVDMATYKAEFMAHYYAGRPRPLATYAFGLIFYWARLAQHTPRLVNLLTHAPVLSHAAKAIVGMAPERSIPSFAPQTFKAWFRARVPSSTLRISGDPSRSAKPGTRNSVLLWPDTFYNYFYPETARAAVEVLEAAGFEVLVPDRPMCCGRPIYDYGMLDLGRRLLREILDTLAPHIRAGVPLVVLEPGCASTFRDELTNLFPHDEDALRVAQQTYLLCEFLEHGAPSYQPPALHRRAQLHGHCHHKAIMKLTAEEAVLRRMGVEFETLDSGCCGLAGSFGYDKDHYEVSMACGERVLLPAVRRAANDTLIIADGFSCRQQIAHGTNRRALHLAQVIQMAMREGEDGSPAEHPEQSYVAAEQDGQVTPAELTRVAAIGVGAVAAGALVWRRLKGR